MIKDVAERIAIVGTVIASYGAGAVLFHRQLTVESMIVGGVVVFGIGSVMYLVTVLKEYNKK